MIEAFKRFQELLNKQQNSSNLQDSIELCSHQKSLSLIIGYQGKIGIHGSKIISDGLQLFKNLEDLTIDIKSGNEIGSNGMHFIASSFIHLQSLTRLYLNIEYNSIGFIGAIQLGKGIANLINLTDLSVIIRSYNWIYEAGAKSLGAGLSKLLKLTKLKIIIEYNTIKNEGMESIAKNISKLQNLKYLHIEIGNDNEIEKEGAIALGNCFQTLNNLEILECIICDNNIQEEGAKAIANGLKYFTNLQKLQLTLEFNSIQNEGFISICEGIKQNKNLTYLKIKTGYNNKIIISQISQLVQCFESLPSIKYLHIDIIFDDEDDYILHDPMINYKLLKNFVKQLVILKQLHCFNFNRQFQNQITHFVIRYLKRVVLIG